MNRLAVVHHAALAAQRDDGALAVARGDLADDALRKVVDGLRVVGIELRRVRVIQIAKSKEGRRGKGVFAFDGRHQTFAPYTRDDEKGRKEKTDGEAPGQMALEEVPEDKNAPF